MFDQLEEIYRKTDEAVSEIIRQYKTEVKCRKGCTDCCHAVFDISLIEALYIQKSVGALKRKTRRPVASRSAGALKEWRDLVKSGRDINTARIRCPLLSEDGECVCYHARPANCRTYGVPTAIEGKGHVCGSSGFRKGEKYTTLDLVQIHDALKRLSIKVAGEELGVRRWPVAAVVLDVNTSLIAY